MVEKKSSVRVGLIGLGNMGQNHLRVLSILKTVDLVFIHDADTTKAKKLAEAHQAHSFQTLEDAYKNPVDAIIICTPTSTHAEQIKQAIHYTKNIFVEKPMAATLSEALEIKKLVDNKDINLQIGFIERFNPAVTQLKNILDRSGKIINIDFTRTNKLSNRITDVDVISDLMIHDIDLALYLNGPVKHITAHGMVENNLVGFATAILTHENGAFSRILASRVTEKKMRQIEATCEDTFIDCELLHKEIIVHSQSRIQQEEGRPYTISAVREAIEVKPQEALLLQHQSFIASCQGIKNPANSNIDDGVESLKICDIIQKEIYNA